MKRLVLIAIVAACSQRKPLGPAIAQVPAATSTPPVVSATPLERAQQVLDAQLVAMQDPTEEDANLRATFDPAALVLIESAPDSISNARRGFRDAFTRRAPHETVESVRCDDLVANGTQHAVWFTCMLHVQQDDGLETVRVTELLTEESGWRVAVAAFNEPGEPRAGKGSNEANATTPLTLIATEPRRISELLEPGAVVTGFEQRYATVAEARAFLGGLPAMTLEYAPDEVSGAGWGYVIAQLTYEGGRKYPMHISILLIAIRDGARGWRVVAVHYT